MIIKVMNLRPIKQVVPFELVRGQKALIMPIGDVHFGADGFPVQKFITHLKWGMDRGVMFLGMGEYLDWAPVSQRQLLAPMRESSRRPLDDMIRRKADEFLKIAGQ